MLDPEQLYVIVSKMVLNKLKSRSIRELSLFEDLTSVIRV